MNKETVAAALLEYDGDEEGFLNWMAGYIFAQYDEKDVTNIIDKINEMNLDGHLQDCPNV